MPVAWYYTKSIFIVLSTKEEKRLGHTLNRDRQSHRRNDAPKGRPDQNTIKRQKLSRLKPWQRREIESRQQEAT